MSKPLRNGRSGSDPRHVRLYEWLLRSPAWQSLDVYEKALYVEFKARYNGTNNGGISFSGDEMAAALNCSNKPADRALRVLIERGFVRLSEKGSFDWKTRGEGRSRASTYILTEHGIDLPVRSVMPPTKDFMKWRPTDAAKNKTRGDEGTPLGGQDTPIKPGMGGRDTPNGSTSSPDKAKHRPLNGGTSSPTYNIPRSGPDEAHVCVPVPTAPTNSPDNAYDDDGQASELF